MNCIDLGVHTEQVLRDVVGLDEAAIQRLVELGVTRTEPSA
jgi:hypothetical protein